VMVRNGGSIDVIKTKKKVMAGCCFKACSIHFAIGEKRFWWTI